MENKCCHVWKLTILILWYCSNYISILVQSALLRESWVKHGLLLDGGKGTLLVIFGTRSSTVSTCAWMPLFSSIQLLSRVRLFATPWTAACQASLSITSSWSLLKLMSIESVMPSNHLILCHPLLLPPSIVPSIRVFSNESALRIRWPKYRSFSFSISPSSEYSGLISFRISLQSKGLSRVFSNTTVQKHQFFSAQLSL